MSKKMMVYGVLSLFLLLPLLSGCGGGGSNNGGSPPPTTTPFSITMIHVPAASSFPTGFNDSTTGTVDKAFLMAETEVTYQLWDTVYDWATDAARGTNRYYFENPGKMGGGNGGDTDQHPVTCVSWRDAIVWCNALTEYYNAQNQKNLACVYTNSGVIRDSRYSNGTVCDNATAEPSAVGFRLPTGLEWELAARYRGSVKSSNAIFQSGLYWTYGNYASGATDCVYSMNGPNLNQEPTKKVAVCYTTNTEKVKSREPNALGLYDMSGNVWEWRYEKDNSNSSMRYIRGGSFTSDAEQLQLSYVEHYSSPDNKSNDVGFRLVRYE